MLRSLPGLDTKRGPMGMNGLQDYMVHEYVWDYREGRLSRRDLMRRVLLITGSASGIGAVLNTTAPGGL